MIKAELWNISLKLTAWILIPALNSLPLLSFPSHVSLVDPQIGRLCDKTGPTS